MNATQTYTHTHTHTHAMMHQHTITRSILIIIYSIKNKILKKTGERWGGVGGGRMQLNNRNPNITIPSSKAFGVRINGHNVTTHTHKKTTVYCLTSLFLCTHFLSTYPKHSSANWNHISTHFASFNYLQSFAWFNKIKIKIKTLNI